MYCQILIFYVDRVIIFSVGQWQYRGGCESVEYGHEGCSRDD